MSSITIARSKARCTRMVVQKRRRPTRRSRGVRRRPIIVTSKMPCGDSEVDTRFGEDGALRNAEHPQLGQVLRIDLCRSQIQRTIAVACGCPDGAAFELEHELKDERGHTKVRSHRWNATQRSGVGGQSPRRSDHRPRHNQQRYKPAHACYRRNPAY
jgi:hypothetical protein